jgi:hypothetical protein
MTGPLGVLPTGPAATTIEDVEDVDGGPLGVLPVDLTVVTTEVKGDVDGRPPRGCYQRVQQRPPPKLKETLMVGP